MIWNRDISTTFNAIFRLGNQLGFLSFGLEYHLKFGVKIIISEGQAEELSHAFAMEKICYLKSPFCVIKPKQCDYPKIPKVPFPQTSGNLTGRRIDLQRRSSICWPYWKAFLDFLTSCLNLACKNVISTWFSLMVGKIVQQYSLMFFLKLKNL